MIDKINMRSDMTKTMIQPSPEKLPNWWVTKLYEGVAPSTANINEIREWCRENCSGPYYTYPSWTEKKGVQFENYEDSQSFIVWSRLRWL